MTRFLPNLTGFWKLTWVETKVFVREPMGLVGNLALPVVLFWFLNEAFGDGRGGAPAPGTTPFNIAIVASLIIAVSAVLSLITIITIYREGGILKRLRATPLSPVTILGAHVTVKLLFTILSLAVLVVAGRQFVPGGLEVNLPAFTAALLWGTLSILSLGFVIASIVPTARFAQPIGAALLYPMVVLSGAFFSLSELPGWLQAVLSVLPTTHAVTLMQGVWWGFPLVSLWGAATALLAIFLVCCAVSTRVFRWE